jgi:transcriptional regulator with XRE-family HTH domain
MRTDRIDLLLEEKGLSRRALEREAGLGVGTITKWRDRTPSLENIQKVASVLGVSVPYLTGESDFRTEQDALLTKWTEQMDRDLPDQVRRIEAGIRIPVLSAVPYGIPEDAVEFLDSEEWVEISEVTARLGRFYGWIIPDDSMFPRICKGDLLIVQYTTEAPTDTRVGNGDLVMVRTDPPTCRRVVRLPEGDLYLPFNYQWDPVLSTDSLIIGRVVEIRVLYH